MHFAGPVLAVLAALSATVDAQRAVCSRKQYADVANSIQNPAYFCKFWLAQKRRGSVTPLTPKYGVRSLTNLCRCFVQNSPRVRGPFKPLRPKAPPSGCPVSLYRPLKNQYKNPAQFCRWYNSVPRELSPLPAVPNPRAVVQACRCFLNKRFAAQQTTTTENEPEPEPTDEPTETTSTEEPVQTTTTTTTTTTTSAIVDGLTTTGLFTLPTILPTTTSIPEIETTTTSAEITEAPTSTATETTAEETTTVEP